MAYFGIHNDKLSYFDSTYLFLHDFPFEIGGTVAYYSSLIIGGIVATDVYRISFPTDTFYINSSQGFLELKLNSAQLRHDWILQNYNIVRN